MGMAHPFLARLAAVFLAGSLLSGCGSDAPKFAVTDSDLKAEEDVQSTLALDTTLDEHAQLLDVAFPLSAAAADLCGKDVTEGFGINIATLSGLREELRDAAAKKLSLDDMPQILHVVPNSPADKARNATPEPASLSIGLPILKAAADESREELQDLWARLLAAAADPGRSRAFRLAFIEIVKKMDPLDAIFLLAAAESESKSLTGGQLTAIANRTGATPDQVDISAASLKTLGVLSPPHTFVLSALGREFVRAISN